ncbi:MAG: hypothetical protein D8M58_08600 [Calditrichaeota bacterium]|nr:MAG: hypothetical protein DWQ03_17890 [Calditrichota bacterium]MBL1205442.1 hypothetical protein [Calditrichota bacterium]NOG45271.1 hypothetical protein [Calditrichota bacterium]
MATNSAKGSILFKILIALLFIALVFVITIPADIWKEEELEQASAQYNMTSIYEAEKFYYRMTKEFTTDKDKLLSVIREDSTLKQVQQLVHHTQDLKTELDVYLNNPYLKSLLIIDQNITTISEDVEKNARWFAINDDIATRADGLSLKLQSFNNDLNYPNYIGTTNILDTLYQLRRDLSDYNLQTAASRCAELTEKLNTFVSDVEFENFETEWSQLFVELTSFRKDVDQIEDISQQTSVAARIREFSGLIEENVQAIGTINISESISAAESSSTKLAGLYDTFLQDYIVTSKRALYRLALEDSMVLYINEKNFTSIGNNQPYVLGITEDSSDIKVESPMLVDELLEKVRPLAETVSTFDFVQHYIAYLDTIKSIHNKGMGIKKLMRRNIDVTVKNKEIEERINNYQNSSEFNAANDLITFVELVGSSRSFSDLKNSVESSRNAVSIFDQLYSGNKFNNIDSLNTSILADLEEYNTILSNIRRLPRGVEKFDNEPSQVNEILANMKKQSSSSNSEHLKGIQAKLEEALLFASEGKSERVYVVFEKNQQNYGYVNRSEKSWEEE